MPNKPRLTIRNKKFCDKLHSMKEPNQRVAYESAYKCRGHTAEVEACNLLKKPLVAEYLQKLKDKATKQAEKSAQDIIKELEILGFSNIGDYVTFDSKGVKLKNSSELTRKQLAAISEVSETETKEGGSRRFKLHDKKGSLELLGKRFGIFPNPG